MKLEDRMLYYRGLTDYKLMPKSYVMVMLDGRSFSTFTKKYFKEKPYSGTFNDMMDETAKYVCENVSGCKLAYVQSDEISLVLTDFENIDTQPFFGYRLCKMQSIIASLATVIFNRLLIKDYLYKKSEEIFDIITDEKAIPFCQFDCKCWNLPSYDEVFNWFLYRQRDGIRNSKQMFAQAYIPHNRLQGLTTDEQIELVYKEYGMDWLLKVEKGQQFGRFIYKEQVEINGLDGEKCIRNRWTIHEANPLEANPYTFFLGEDYNGREWFDKLNVIPKM